MKQALPFAVQIELVEGCNLRCPFCGINGIRGSKRTYKAMTRGTAQAVARSFKRADYRGRVEFAMHGEPTLHPEPWPLVTELRRAAPKSHFLVLTNGAGLLRKTRASARRWFMAGVNTLGVDEYQQVNLAKKVMRGLGNPKNGDRLKMTAKVRPIFYRYPADPKGNPHRPMKGHRLVHIAPIDLADEGTHAMLNNHAGSGAPKNRKGDGKRCAKPFREVSVRWDGSVAVCCNDWRGELPIGNVNEEDLFDKIWQHSVMQAARRKLYHGQRDFGPCDGCDAMSYRVGLLPDPKGKESLPMPTKADRLLLDHALARPPLTEAVARPWE